MKQSLQNETYSKLHEIRGFQAKMDGTLSRTIGVVEKARLTLASGQALEEGDFDIIRAIVDKADKGDLVDTRDWCLFPDIGGNLPRLQDLLVFGRELDAKWVAEWGRLLGVVAAYSQSLDVETLALPESAGFVVSALSKTRHELTTSSCFLAKRRSCRDS